MEAQSKNILIVDDDEAICLFLNTVLSNEGFHTAVAYNGQEALKIVKENKIDLITLDWMMPILSGFDVLKQLQKDQIRVPVLVITASVTDGKTIQAIREELNVVDFIIKPLDYIEFTKKVHQVLKTEPRPR